jgi:predicted tellurium resistance membrane protein TerC
MSAHDKPKGDKQKGPVVITSAQDALSNEQRGRARRYFTSMMIRTACFIAAIFLPNPYRWFAMGGALVLPYIAVVIANAGRENTTEMNAIIIPKPREIEN